MIQNQAYNSSPGENVFASMRKISARPVYETEEDAN